jgi:hypothetical protein
VGAADAAGLWVAAEAARGTGLVKRLYWVLVLRDGRELNEALVGVGS